eukprot:6454015-Alexandrium_andersonii.AAC.1
MCVPMHGHVCMHQHPSRSPRYCGQLLVCIPVPVTGAFTAPSRARRRSHVSLQSAPCCCTVADICPCFHHAVRLLPAGPPSCSRERPGVFAALCGP